MYSVLVWKPEGKRPLGSPRLRWVNNIRMDLWRELFYRFLVAKPKGKFTLGDLVVFVWIILGWILGLRSFIGSCWFNPD